MLKNKNFKIGLYIRVSSEEQAENPEGSLKNQEQRLREAVAFRNRQSSFGEIAGVYIDAGISAKDMNRPQLQNMLRDVRSGKISLVMVTEISRLSRNNRDFLSMWDMMHDQKCSFMSLREDFDTTTAAGEMLMFQLMNFAQFERKQTSERVAANILARASRGLYNGGSIPLGYKKSHEKTGYLEIDEPHAATVRIAFDTFLKEGSLSRTARWLNNNGYKSKSHLEGGGSRMRLGHFTVDNLHLILKNKIYIGVKVYRQKDEVKETKAAWEGIVDIAVFNRVNELLAKNKSRLKPVTDKSKYPYLISGVSFCMTCGDYMPGKSANGRNGKVPYYEHSWATKRESCLSKKTFKCDPHRVQAKKIEPLVWTEFCKFLDSKEFILSLMEKVKALHGHNDEEQERKRLKSKIGGLNSQLEALAERLEILPKTVSPGPLFKQMEKLEAAKKEHQERLMQLKELNLDQRLVAIETLESFAKVASKTLKETEDFNVKRMILQKFIRRVEIGVESVKIFWNLDKDFYETELKIKEFSPANSAGEASSYLNGLEGKKKAPARDGAFKNFSTNVGSQSLTYGAPLLQVVEPIKFIITRGYPVRCYKVKTDFALLARKRWIEGASIGELAQLFEVAEETVKGYLRQLKDQEKLKALGILDKEMSAIYKGMAKE
jgi:DNA invertase Pin-like site-specific DNA recombinase